MSRLFSFEADDIYRTDNILAALQWFIDVFVERTHQPIFVDMGTF